jgi:hypothetical protein
MRIGGSTAGVQGGRYRVEPMAAERVAAAQAARAQPASSEKSVTCYRFSGVIGAGREKAARSDQPG